MQGHQAVYTAAAAENLDDMQPIIRTSRLTKRFQGTTALADVDLEIPPGVVFGYLGPNGAGKTTTIRLLTGLLRPTRGSAAVMGFDTVREREAAQSHIGYLPGMFAAYPGLTGEQYLGYLGNMRGGGGPSTTTRLAKRLDLDLSQRICTLPHGNRQKLGIVQAFQHDPDVLILDEPTAGLDPLAQREFLTLVHEARDAGLRTSPRPCCRVTRSPRPSARCVPPPGVNVARPSGQRQQHRDRSPRPCRLP